MPGTFGGAAAPDGEQVQGPTAGAQPAGPAHFGIPSDGGSPGGGTGPAVMGCSLPPAVPRRATLWHLHKHR